METATKPTIQTSELRLGNKVYVKPDQNTKELIATITGIKNEEIEVEGRYTFHYSALDLIQLIPITHGILEAANFKIRGNIVIYCGPAPDNLGEFQFEGDSLWYGYYDEYGFTGIMSIPYLHNLQNLMFCLTGSDLEITPS